MEKTDYIKGTLTLDISRLYEEAGIYEEQISQELKDEIANVFKEDILKVVNAHKYPLNLLAFAMERTFVIEKNRYER